jgi:K+-transporting ATPase KdpF subunit
MRTAVTLDLVVGLVLAVLALVYLTYAMLRPERF